MAVACSPRWIIWEGLDRTSHTTVDIFLFVCSDMDSGEVVIFRTQRMRIIIDNCRYRPERMYN